MAPPKPIPLEEAQARLCNLVSPLPVEQVPVERAIGRYLAEDLRARRTQPPADLSAMDGYAVGGDDLAGPWRVVGESAAGHPYQGEIRRGEAARISTGAHMPAGTGAMLLQENAIRDGDRLTLSNEDGPTPRHIRREGFDFADGDRVLAAGTRIGPAQLALAISAGHGEISAPSLPGLAVIDSGDELCTDPANCGPHQIPASNGPALAALGASLTSNIVRIGPVRDQLADVVDAFERASEADVIVTSGGASVGDHDLMKPALEQWGAAIDFWRVAIKPGKPLMVARKGQTTILGLPGNPVSSFVTAWLFLLPLLRKLAGARDVLPRTLLMPLRGQLEAGGSRTEFLRGRIVNGGIEPIDERDSSALRALAAAEALIRRDIAAPAVADGQLVPIYPLQNGGNA
ncbi:molybdopterin molybdotransferase MoeA [Aurantiacibacter sp. MUD11]|uniref:molybdopterin molybdotransferase MoeA n=1 Tax=Aurantiacibacter sp. MUD11 TaxID=3003265 RepID=UPI0022AA3EEC|nr:molybdopterin molybdotransferase MoeA [Aurantiacibacter sp. MUD11]WAT18444.1 molybdopterin molybdotransferase MoeA [Aurantiacibacter sp. MUD11]